MIQYASKAYLFANTEIHMNEYKKKNRNKIKIK